MSSKRQSRIERGTAETQIELVLDLDGRGKADIDTGIGFFDHMLELFAKHGFFDLTVKCKGDLSVDPHHTVEDTGICLGSAIAQASGDKSGIVRYGCSYVPMDEALARAVVDLSGRSSFIFKADIRDRKIGHFPTELLPDFFKAAADNAKMNLHIDLIRGENSHHSSEAIFKAFARALDRASSISQRVKGVLSTKGTLQ